MADLFANGYEYRLVTSRVERRPLSSVYWRCIYDAEWPALTADELELIVRLIRTAAKATEAMESEKP